MSESSGRPEDFSKRLREARELRGMSQADLAAKAGFQTSAISHFETGMRLPSFENLKRLADALSVTTDFLLGRSNEPKASGPVIDKLARHAERLTDSDLAELHRFAEFLSKRPRKEEDRR